MRSCAKSIHLYAAEWSRDQISFFVDDMLVKTVGQSPAYPMQLMLSIYEFPGDDDARDPAAYPKAFVADHVRGYRLTS